MQIYSLLHVGKIFLITKSVISNPCIKSLNDLCNESGNEPEKGRIFLFVTEALTLILSWIP